MSSGVAGETTAREFRSGGATLLPSSDVAGLHASFTLDLPYKSISSLSVILEFMADLKEKVCMANLIPESVCL